MARRPATERLSERKQRHNVNPMRDKIHHELCVYQRPFLKRYSDEILLFSTLSTDELGKSDIFRNPAKFSFIQKASLELLMAGTSSEKKTEQFANFKQLSVFDHASVLVDMSARAQKPVAILVGTNDAALQHAHAIWSWYLARYMQELPIVLFGFKLSARDEHVYRHGFIKPTQLVNHVFKQANDSLIQFRRLKEGYKVLDKKFKAKEKELAHAKTAAAQPAVASTDQVASLREELSRLNSQLTELQTQLGEAQQVAAGVEHLQRHVRALEDAQTASSRHQGSLQAWVGYYKEQVEALQAEHAHIRPAYDRLSSIVASAGPTDPRLKPEEKIVSLQLRIQTLEGQTRAYACQLVSMGNELEKAKAESQTLQLTKINLEKNIGELGRDRSSYESDIAQLHQQLRERHTQLGERERLITGLTKHKKKLLEQQASNQQEIQRLGEVLDETLSKLSVVEGERDALKAAPEAARAAVKPLEEKLKQAQALHGRDEAALANAQAEIQQLRAALNKEKAEQKREKRMHARAARKLARIAAAGLVIHDSEDEGEDDIPLAKRAKQPRRAAKPVSTDDRTSSEDLVVPAVGPRSKPSAKRRHAASPAAVAATPMGASASPCSAGGAGMFATQPHVRAARTPSPYKQLLAQSVETSVGKLSVSQVQGRLASALDEVTQKHRKIGDRLTLILGELKALSVYFRDLKTPEEAANQAYEYVLSMKFWVSYLLYQPDYNAQPISAELQDAFKDINIDTSRFPLPLYLIAADEASANWTKDMLAIAPRKYGDIKMSRKTILTQCDQLNLLPMSALKQLNHPKFMVWYPIQLKGSLFTKLMWTHLTWRAVSKTDSPNKSVICTELVKLQNQLGAEFNQRVDASSASDTPSHSGVGAAAAAARSFTF